MKIQWKSCDIIIGYHGLGTIIWYDSYLTLSKRNFVIYLKCWNAFLLIILWQYHSMYFCNVQHLHLNNTEIALTFIESDISVDMQLENREVGKIKVGNFSHVFVWVLDRVVRKFLPTISQLLDLSKYNFHLNACRYFWLNACRYFRLTMKKA